MNFSISIRPSQPPSRSCAKCGTEFRTSAKEYTCPDCRSRKRAGPAEGSGLLSFRERQIVVLVQQAKANKQIAYELCLTEGTVKEYLYRIFRKLNVASRTELAVRACRDTITPQDPLPIHALKESTARRSAIYKVPASLPANQGGCLQNREMERCLERHD